MTPGSVQELIELVIQKFKSEGQANQFGSTFMLTAGTQAGTFGRNGYKETVLFT